MRLLGPSTAQRPREPCRRFAPSYWQRSASFDGRVSTTIVAMRLILVTGRQKCNTHSPFGSVCSKMGLEGQYYFHGSRNQSF
jgi:hypothetical protein